jgi:hypothetical protein
MAQAEIDPTRSDDAASKASSPWLLLEDVFQRWRVRLKSSHEAVDELNALLRDRETHSRKRRVDTRGEEIPDTLSFLNAQFWQDDGALLLVVPDADGVGDRLRIGTIAALVGMIDYTEYADVYLDAYFPGGHWEFSVRRLDVERHERLYFPMTAAAASPPAPATKGRGSRQQRMIQQIVAEEFPNGWDQIETGVIIQKVGNRLQRQRLAVPKRDTFLRALDRRKD